MTNKKKPVKYKGKVYPTLSKLCRDVKAPVSFFCVEKRIQRGWSLERALFTPKMFIRNNSIRKESSADLTKHRIKNLVDYCKEISNSVELRGINKNEYQDRFGY